MLVGVAELPEALSTATHEVVVSTLLAPKKSLDWPFCRGFIIAAFVNALFARMVRAQVRAVRVLKSDTILSSGQGGMCFAWVASQFVSREARYRTLTSFRVVATPSSST